MLLCRLIVWYQSFGWRVSIFRIAFSCTIKQSQPARFSKTEVPVYQIPRGIIYRRLKSSTTPLWKPQISKAISEQSTVVRVIGKLLPLCVDEALTFLSLPFCLKALAPKFQIQYIFTGLSGPTAVYETKILDVHKYIKNTVNPKEWMLLTF